MVQIATSFEVGRGRFSNCGVGGRGVVRKFWKIVVFELCHSHVNRANKRNDVKTIDAVYIIETLVQAPPFFQDQPYFTTVKQTGNYPLSCVLTISVSLYPHVTHMQAWNVHKFARRGNKRTYSWQHCDTAIKIKLLYSNVHYIARVISSVRVVVIWGRIRHIKQSHVTGRLW